jgi:hypothetical protein
MKHSLFFAFVAAVTLVLIGCNGKPIEQRRQWLTFDPAKTNSFEITSFARPNSISGLHLWVTGHVSGTSILMIAGSREIVLSGNVDVRKTFDWFDTNCWIGISPRGVESGRVGVGYVIE